MTESDVDIRPATESAPADVAPELYERASASDRRPGEPNRRTRWDE